MKARNPMVKQEFYLRSNVIWCPAKRCCGDIAFYTFFTHSKICDFTVTISIQQDIVKFQISEMNFFK